MGRRSQQRSDRILQGMKQTEPVTPISENMILPNTSGDHVKGFKREAPTNDWDLANKKYVDDNSGGAPEGTAIKSTGETNDKYLRADGDGTCSWQTTAGGTPEGTAVLSTGEAVTKYLRADGDNSCSWQIPAGDTHAAGDGSDHADVASNTTHRGSDGTDHANVVLNDAHRADVTGDPHNIAADTLTFTNKTFDANGTGNSITNIENADIKADAAIAISKTALVAGTNITLSTNTLNVDDAFLKNDAADVGVGLTLTGDNSSADTAYVPMVLYNTDATPPAANTVPIGTIYIQYTA